MYQFFKRSKSVFVRPYAVPLNAEDPAVQRRREGYNACRRMGNRSMVYPGSPVENKANFVVIKILIEVAVNGLLKRVPGVRKVNTKRFKIRT